MRIELIPAPPCVPGAKGTRKLLITGGGGFVGRHLLARLVATGNQIIALHNRPLPPEVRQQFGEAVTWVSADITRDDLFSIVRDVATVFHLAAYSGHSESDDDVARMHQVNVVGTDRLASVSKAAGVRHFIFVSSVAACEFSSVADISESGGFPTSTYGKTKKAAEDSLLAMSCTEFSVTVLRPSALFGTNHLGSVYDLVKVIDQGRFFIIGNGANRTNFYYVEDLVDVLIAVENNAKAFGQVFIASDEPHTLRDLVSSIGAALGSKRHVPRIPLFLGLAIGKFCDSLSMLTGKSLPLSTRRVRAMTRDVVYSNGKLQRVIGIRAKVGLFEGIRRSIDWYRQVNLL